MIEDVAYWPSGAVRIVWHDQQHTNLPLTGAHGFCFYHGAVLVCSGLHRGFTIPGGHIKEGESAIACLVREAAEEACVELSSLTLLGFVEADHHENCNFDGNYPLQSVQAIYRADIAAMHDFTSRHETTERRFVSVKDLPSGHHEWNSVMQKALEAAVEATGG